MDIVSKYNDVEHPGYRFRRVKPLTRFRSLNSSFTSFCKPTKVTKQLRTIKKLYHSPSRMFSAISKFASAIKEEIHISTHTEIILYLQTS